MRADTITVRRLDAAEATLHIGAVLALGGLATASVPLAAVGAAVVLAASAWAGVETHRAERVVVPQVPPRNRKRGAP